MNTTTLWLYLQQQYALRTAKEYFREINIFLSNYPQAPQAAYKDITHYIGLLRNRYNNPYTISKILSSIKAYYSYLCHEAIRTDNPARAVQLKERPHRGIQLQDLFTTEELEILLHQNQRYQSWEERNNVLITLLIYQGLRPVEMAAIQVNDINLITGTIYIKATAKTNSRTLALKPNQILLFHHYIQHCRQKLLQKKNTDTTVLLISKAGGAMKCNDIIMRVLQKYRNLYEGRVMSTKTIRQSVIANLLKQGHDIGVVQAFGGYKSADTIKLYSTKQVSSLQAAIDKYHPLQ
jgi:integrase/recombinase XerD